jgi:hypothetical protein
MKPSKKELKEVLAICVEAINEASCGECNHYPRDHYDGSKKAQKCTCEECGLQSKALHRALELLSID